MAAHFKGRLRITPAVKGTTKEDAAKAHKAMIRNIVKDPTRILMYSDGSLLTDKTGRRRVGASHVALRQQHLLFGRRISMSPRAEVFDAEMAGLAWAARDATAYLKEHHDIRIRHLHFFADNTSAVSAIFEVKTTTAQGYSHTFRELATAFLDAHPENTVTVEWTPGYKGITGNEMADELAKEAAEEAPPHRLASWAAAR